ncbi:MAG: amino acid ABC transporter permease [Thermincolia bacterium]
MNLNFPIIIDYIPVLLFAAGITLEITVVSVFLGTIIGLVIALGRLSQNKPIRWLSAVYVDFIRGTPLLVQIFIIYFGIPMLIGVRIDPFVAAVVSCSINSGAYIAEIFRAGIQSIDKGQMEAARSLGMSRWQAMRFIILPQAFKRVIPPLGNEFIAMMKDTSLLSVIGYEELTRKAQLIVAVNYHAFELYTAIALIYLVMTLAISRWVSYMERRLKTGDSH